MNLRLAFVPVALVGALAMTGCATVKSNDPCYGFLVTPNTATNSDMIRQSAGVQPRPSSVVLPRPRGTYHGFGSPVHYNTLFNNLGKPSELVFTVTSVNGIRHDVKAKNNSSEFLTWGLAAVGAVAGARTNAAVAVGGGVLGAFLGSKADGSRNDGVAESTKACIRDIQAGGQDGVLVKTLPAGQRLPVAQQEDRGLGLR
jgi:hypothetical protein